MKDTTIGSEIRDPNQKFIYLYDFNKNWSFLIELINVSKEENPRLIYPATIRVEGIAPSQYGTKGLLGEKFADVEEKYDLSQVTDGFGSEGEENGESDDLGLGEEAPDEGTEEV
jgi:pRiA4b ORF-3-like protein